MCRRVDYQQKEILLKPKEFDILLCIAQRYPAIVSLTDFMKMNNHQAERWIKENKAENPSLIEEYSDTIEKGKPIRSEITNAEVTPETYQRKDPAKVYFSKGKQTYQKDIKVPDF